MPPHRNHAPLGRVIQPPEIVTRQHRISKSKARETIKAVTTAPHRCRITASLLSHSVSSSSTGTATSRLEPNRLIALEKSFELMLEVQQMNKVTLDQLVEHLDGMSGVSLASPVVAPITDILSILP